MEVRIWADKLLDAIQVVYETMEGKKIEGEKHGGDGGKRWDPLTFGKVESITGISGKYGEYVDSLTIMSNSKNYDCVPQRFGGDGGAVEYQYTAPKGFEIGGFHGRADKYVDAIGVILRPIER